jgi:hypothetical protein
VPSSRHGRPQESAEVLPVETKLFSHLPPFLFRE